MNHYTTAIGTPAFSTAFDDVSGNLFVALLTMIGGWGWEVSDLKNNYGQVYDDDDDDDDYGDDGDLR